MPLPFEQIVWTIIPERRVALVHYKAPSNGSLTVVEDWLEDHGGSSTGQRDELDEPRSKTASQDAPDAPDTPQRRRRKRGSTLSNHCHHSLPRQCSDLAYRYESRDQGAKAERFRLMEM